MASTKKATTRRRPAAGSRLQWRQAIPVRHTVDVCVAGGGPAGVAAAVAAARQGAKVFLIEGQNSFGGMGTGGLVPAFMQFADGVNFMAGGIGREIHDTLWQWGAAGPADRPDTGHKMLSIRVEALKRLYDEMVAAAGVGFAFHTQLMGVKAVRGRVSHALCAAKSGVFAVQARMFVDCTGDGDLAAWAGAPFEKGDAEGRLMPGTLCSLWADVDWDQVYASKLWPQTVLPKAIEQGLFTIPDRHLPGMWRVGRHVGGGNIGHTFGVDSTDERSLTTALVWGRKLLLEYERFYKEMVPGYAQMELVASGSLLGIRESRRIMGDYMLNLEDFKSRAVFPDEIGRYTYPVDLHPVVPNAETFKAFEEEMRTYRHAPGENYGIPYRCLVPRRLKNVLVAGRCVSTDRPVQGSLRVMPGCYITGQAAGLAAALAAAGKADARAVAVPELQRRLKAMGAFLPNYR